MPFVERLSATSSISGKEFKAHRKFAFQILGFGVSFSLYFPVCSAHARNKQASVFIFPAVSRGVLPGKAEHLLLLVDPLYTGILSAVDNPFKPRSHSQSFYRHFRNSAANSANTKAADGNVYGDDFSWVNFANDGKLLKRDQTAFDLSRACQAYTRCVGISNNETVSQSHAYVSFAFNFHL